MQKFKSENLNYNLKYLNIQNMSAQNHSEDDVPLNEEEEMEQQKIIETILALGNDIRSNFGQE